MDDRPRSTLIITHTPLTTSSPMRSSPSKLSGKRRSSLHIGNAVHQGRTGRVIDVSFTGETAAISDERSGLAVILIGFRGFRVEGGMQGVRPFHLHVRRHGREQSKSEYEFRHGSFGCISVDPIRSEGSSSGKSSKFAIEVDSGS